ncbi:MAG: MFS transporter [Clostridium sp.]|nr:MFS transporter [Clostridium sp.]
MHTIAVSKLAYDKTNIAMAFGGVIIVQYIVMFLVQFVSGVVVDRNNPKKVIVISDIVRGILILTSGLMCLFTDVGIYLLSAFIFNNVSFDYKRVEQSEDVKKNESLFIKIVQGFFADWKNICKCIKGEKSVMAHLFVPTGDYLSVNFFNVMLVPLVIVFYNDNSFNISLFDCGFAIGSIIAVLFINYILKTIGINNSAVIGLLIQGLILIIISIKINLIIAFLLMILYGVSNSFSITIFNTNLQKRCVGNIKGRVNSIKNFLVSCLTIVLVPLVSKMYDVSIESGLITASSILIIYAAISFVLGRKFVFGKGYLTKVIVIDKNNKLEEKFN